MNTAAVAQQIARRSTRRDITKCDIDEQSAIIDALNGAVQEFYSTAPAILRKKTYSYLLKTPTTIAMTVNSGSKNTQDFDDDQIGCSIQLANDPVRNEVDGKNQLLFEYSGIDANPAAQLWYDALQLPDEIEYLSDAPELRTVDGSGNTATNQRRQLVRDENDYSRFMYFGRTMSEFDSVAGTPQRYSLEPRARDAIGNPTEARSILRVYPPPSQSFKLKFEAVVAPRFISVGEIRLGSYEFPVEQRYIRNIIIPIALELYSSEPYFEEQPAHRLKKIEMDAAKARRSIEAISADFAPSHNTVGTPYGF